MAHGLIGWIGQGARCEQGKGYIEFIHYGQYQTGALPWICAGELVPPSISEVSRASVSGLETAAASTGFLAWIDTYVNKSN